MKPITAQSARRLHAFWLEFFLPLTLVLPTGCATVQQLSCLRHPFSDLIGDRASSKNLQQRKKNKEVEIGYKLCT